MKLLKKSKVSFPFGDFWRKMLFGEMGNARHYNGPGERCLDLKYNQPVQTD